MADKTNSTNGINREKRILDFENMKDHQSLIEHLEVLIGRYRGLHVVPLSMCEGRIVPAVFLGHGSRITVYTADADGESFLPSQLLMRYINEYCEIRQSGRRVFGIDLLSFEESRSVCVIPISHTTDGVAYTADSVSGDRRLSIELKRGDSHITCAEASCTGRCRGVAQSVGRLCGLPPTIDPGLPETSRPHFNIYCGRGYETEEQGFFRTYASVRELLFVAPIIV